MKSRTEATKSAQVVESRVFRDGYGPARRLDYLGADSWEVHQEDASGEWKLERRGDVLGMRRWFDAPTGHERSGPVYDQSRQEAATAWKFPRSGDYFKRVKRIRKEVEQIFYGTGSAVCGSPMGGWMSFARNRILLEPEADGSITAWRFQWVAWSGSGTDTIARGLRTRQEIIDACKPYASGGGPLDEAAIDRVLQTAELKMQQSH